MPDRTAQSPIPLDLSFRGDRDYLQGTAIYDAVVEATLAAFPGSADATGMIAFHRLLPTQPDLWLAGPGDDTPPPATPATSFGFEGRDGRIRGWLLDTSRPVLRREAYDEEAIRSVTRLAGEGIALLRDPGCTPIEAAVALTKFLHHAVLPMPGRKWLFTRLDFARPLRDSDLAGMAVALRSNIHGRVTRSDLSNADGVLGSIYFSAA
jgi:hypothetical protein